MLLGVVVENICCGRHLFKKKKQPFLLLICLRGQRLNKSFYKKGFQRVVDKPAGLT